MSLITRKQYKNIKKMDRKEMDRFLENLFKDAAKEGMRIESDVNYRMACIEAAKRTQGMGKLLTDRFMLELAAVLREGNR